MPDMPQDIDADDLPSDDEPDILPGVGLAAPDRIVPLRHSPSASEELPDLVIDGRLPKADPRLIRRDAHLVDETEHLLNALIGECGFLMREVAFRCIVQSAGVEDRLAFMRSAMSCAETGAYVAKSVAKLRHAPVNEEAVIARAVADLERKRAESGKQ